MEEKKIEKLFESKSMVKVCAPMVRYSKLPFRSLVRRYQCDLCFTPMIMADSFVKSEKARNNEFTTNNHDTPLVVQFAATNAVEFTEATQLVAPYCDGVDLNCGCPQRWAMKLGIGAQLLSEPETVRDIIHSVRNTVADSFSVSVKLRLLKNVTSTVDMCRQFERAGVRFITVHARTKDQRSEPIDVEALKVIVQSLSIPVVANGDVKTLDEAKQLQNETHCKGVMSARGLLQNPTLFSGENTTTRECVQHWIETCLACNLYFITFHHHLVFMLEKCMDKSQRRIFNSLNSYEKVLVYLNDFFDFNFKYNSQRQLVTESSIWEEKNEKSSYFLDKTKQDSDLEDFLDDSVCLYL